MSNILLIEPCYRSKFPPLGLLRIASYHKASGDTVTFSRGCDPRLRSLKWHKVYVSSLFTYELPRTVRTIKYYRPSVETDEDIVVGGVGATLMPDYIRQNAACRIISGPLIRAKTLDSEPRPIAKYLPDYSIIDDDRWTYQPRDSYFCRVTTGCIRRCGFCAVPVLEPKFSYLQPLRKQVQEVDRAFGERQNLVLLDNNILACENLPRIVADINRSGFEHGAHRNARRRTVDFNQGIDARLITKHVAALLSTVSLFPVRLALDHTAVENAYVRAVRLMADFGFRTFTTYIMFNYSDDPTDFYHRMKLNVLLSNELGIRISGFPMKYVPIHDITRRHVSAAWKWRYLRGMQCILLATHGLVSPRLEFFDGAFGATDGEFLEILSMPDRYIIQRTKYRESGAAADWRRSFRRLSASSRAEFLEVLAVVNRSRDKKTTIKQHRRFSSLLEHYYPGGKPVPCE